MGAFCVPQMKDNKYRKDNKYWCPQCKIFVHNNLVSKKNHEQSPQHQKSVQRELRNAYKDKQQTNYIEPKKVEKRRADVKDYGFDHSEHLEYLKQQQSNEEFLVTEEFQELNQPIIHTTNIGEWEQVEDEEQVKKLLGTDVLEVTETRSLEPKELRVKEIVPDSNSDQDEVLEFKKIKTKRFRK